MSMKPQMFFNRDSKHIAIEEMYMNQSLFLLCGGPSLGKMDLTPLRQPGITTMCVNNAVRVFRPNLWVTVDDPANFIISAWRDPKIMKFTHCGKSKKWLWDNNKWKQSTYRVRECPNVVYYKDNEWFQPDKYLHEDSVNWGNHTDRCECGYWRKDRKKEKRCPKCNEKQFGSRSVLLAAVRVAHILGFRKIFLAGCDFNMSEDNKYAFKQDRTRGSIKNNNATYARLNGRFDRLRPYLEKSGCFVFNCTPDSGLKSFENIDLSVAVRMALKDFPDTDNERTEGMYDRKANEKK